MRYEAEGKLVEAQKIYDAILEEDESNIVGVARWHTDILRTSQLTHLMLRIACFQAPDSTFEIAWIEVRGNFSFGQISRHVLQRCRSMD